MKICILTYDTHHRKTAQVFFGLNALSEFEIDFMLMPFNKREPRKVLFEHRPNQFTGCSAGSIAQKFGNRVIEYENWKRVLNDYDYFLICGSNLIDPEFANCGKILNVHSGLIPGTRGLDSFKWSILNSRPIGNTLHIINEYADSGEILHHMRTPIFQEDDINSFAERHYEMEIWMLQNFKKLLENPRIESHAQSDATMRMNIETERLMLESFGNYVNAYSESPAK